MSTHAHPNGLVLTLPARALDITETATGFRLRPTGSGRHRAPPLLKVDLEPGSHPQGGFPHDKSVGGRKILYRLETDPGGSGGEGHKLTAWLPARDSHIVVEQYVQVEWPNEPDFKLIWLVIAGVELKSAEQGPPPGQGKSGITPAGSLPR